MTDEEWATGGGSDADWHYAPERSRPAWSDHPAWGYLYLFVVVMFFSVAQLFAILCLLSW